MSAALSIAVRLGSGDVAQLTVRQVCDGVEIAIYDQRAEDPPLVMAHLYTDEASLLSRALVMLAGGEVQR